MKSNPVRAPLPHSTWYWAAGLLQPNRVDAANDLRLHDNYDDLKVEKLPNTSVSSIGFHPHSYVTDCRVHAYCLACRWFDSYRSFRRFRNREEPKSRKLRQNICRQKKPTPTSPPLAFYPSPRLTFGTRLPVDHKDPEGNDNLVS